MKELASASAQSGREYEGIIQDKGESPVFGSEYYSNFLSLIPENALASPYYFSITVNDSVEPDNKYDSKIFMVSISKHLNVVKPGWKQRMSASNAFGEPLLAGKHIFSF